MNLIRTEKMNLDLVNLHKYAIKGLLSLNLISISIKVGYKGYFNIYFMLLGVGFIFTIYGKQSDEELRSEEFNPRY